MSKRYFILSLCLSFLLAFALPGYAQNTQTVTGTVVDETGEPVIGATVMVVGTTTGTVTDIDGKFSLPVGEKGKLQVSFIGYVSQTISNLNNPKIVLKEDVAKLDEVVIVGYGSQKMKNVTGAIETIDPEDLKDLSVGSLGDALRGMVNGLGVNSGGSYRPGSAPSLQIRQAAVNTAMTPDATAGGDADTRPLYVIDDFISSESDFNNLDISEVENITILKDASAAVYGSRAAYGVVLVKTKRGKIGAPKISYSGQFGFTDALATPKMLSAYDHARIYNAARGSNTTTKDNDDDNANLHYFQLDEMEAMKHLNYDLLDKEWSAAMTQRHSVNVSGGTEKATYFGGISYFEQDGNLGRLDYERWNYRAGVNANIGKYVKAALQVSGDYGEKNSARFGSGGGTDQDYESLMHHLRFVPDYVAGYPIFHTGMENNIGTYSKQQMYNFAAAENSQTNGNNQTNGMSINGSLEFDLGFLKPLRGLKVKASYSKNISNSKNNSIRMRIPVYQMVERGGSGKHLYTGEGIDYSVDNFIEHAMNDAKDSEVRRTFSRGDSYQMTLTVTYARQFGLHNVSGLFSIEKSESESEDLEGWGFEPLSFTDGQSTAFPDGAELGTKWSRSESGILSYVGRLNYSYADKYLLEFLIRSDASTKFAPANYWGTFPSVSAGWVMSEESWFDKEKLGIDFFKIRASFGLLGRDNIQPWKWTQLYNPNADKGPIFGTNPNLGSSSSFQLPEKAGLNPDAHWDKNYKTNVGVDVRMFDSRFSITMDAYYDRGRDLFATRVGGALPGTVGIVAVPENFGATNTWGVELSLGWKDKIGKDFSYWVKMNTGYSDNKLLKGGFQELPGFDEKVPNQRQDRGLWGLECLGMFRSYQEIDEYFAKYNITNYLGKTREDMHPGMLIYRDVRGKRDENGNWTAPDGIIDKDSDRIKISHRTGNPYGFSMNFGASYKDFSITAQLAASWGSYTMLDSGLLKETYKEMEYKNISAMWSDMFCYNDVYDAQNNIVATKNLDGKMPNLQYADVNNIGSTFWTVSNKSLELRNITVAYSLPKDWLRYVGVSSCRLNLTCQNAFNFFNAYPDDVWASWAGNYNRYPNLRKITLGVNVSF